MIAARLSAADAAVPVRDVVLTGTLFLDIVFTGMPGPPQPGVEIWTEGMGSSPGGIANLAVASARLGLDTALAAVFSDDGYGQWCWGILEDQEGIDLSCSHFHDHWHTPVTISLAYDSDRAMVTHGHRPPCLRGGLMTAGPPARVAFVSLEPEMDDSWWQRYRDAGALVFADVGWDPTGLWDQSIFARLEGCYGFTPNAGEAMAYTRTDSALAAAQALAEHVPLAVVTCGRDGAVACDASSGQVFTVPGLETVAIDPTGAGDVFAAALVTATLRDWPMLQRLRFATLAASLSVAQFGGALAAPGWGDLVDWWRCTKRRAGQGDATSVNLMREYGFLAEVLPLTDCPAVRRAEATIARFSDVQVNHNERKPQ